MSGLLRIAHVLQWDNFRGVVSNGQWHIPWLWLFVKSNKRLTTWNQMPCSINCLQDPQNIEAVVICCFQKEYQMTASTNYLRCARSLYLLYSTDLMEDLTQVFWPIICQRVYYWNWFRWCSSLSCHLVIASSNTATQYNQLLVQSMAAVLHIPNLCILCNWYTSHRLLQPQIKHSIFPGRMSDHDILEPCWPILRLYPQPPPIKPIVFKSWSQWTKTWKAKQKLPKRILP